ncbi:MAG TPA: phosphatase PAP2 family protein [Caulobacteraceae bacterium]|jgi:undecaprenyl-diphosphatase|nr:phosphatase PAP2 family protein [Caulobacteraceae bacterium]
MIATLSARLPPRFRAAFAAVEAKVLAIMILVAGGVWLILGLGGEVREGETSAFDKAVIEALRLPGLPHVPIGPRWLWEAMRDVTALGGTTFVVLATTLAVAGLAFHRNWRRAAVLAGVMICAQSCDELLKGIYGRPRPDFAPLGTYVYAQSFPSGHSTASAALWLSLAMLAASFEPRRREKAFWFAIAGLVIAGVGFSRVFLGVHWPTDVLAGWVLGACWALCGWLVWRTRRAPGA